MGIFSIFLTGFALSMDAFAVSVTKGMTLKKINLSIATKIAFLFGLFQGVMPFIGWLFGMNFELYIRSIDHWIAVFLLSFLGIKMIIEAIKNDNSDDSTYLDNKELTLKICELNLASQSKAAILPLQDLFAIGKEGRMNFPSTLGSSNWSWRITKKLFDKNKKVIASMLLRWNDNYQREND